MVLYAIVLWEKGDREKEGLEKLDWMNQELEDFDNNEQVLLDNQHGVSAVNNRNINLRLM